MALYDDAADSWWDSDGFLHGIGTLLNPVRVPYIDSILHQSRFRSAGRAVLDVGCGGGLLAEPLSELGMVVTGIDVSIRSIAAGHNHSEAVRYAAALADRLPFSDNTFDVVVAMEILEHVDDPAQVVAEAARVLHPGGVLFCAGPSRTLLSRLALIDMAQRWRWTAVLPPELHRWERFVTPSEMSAMLADAGVEPVETTGLGLERGGLLAAIRVWRLLRLGKIGHAEAGRRVRMTARRSTRLAYMGHGVKR